MTIVKHVVIAIFAAGFTVAMYVVWAVMLDQAKDKNVYPISDMLEAAAAGRVAEVKILGTRYEYKVRDRNETFVTYGPKTTQDEAAKIVAGARVAVE